MTGACTVPECGRPGALMARGVRCDLHRAAVPTPDPTLTAAALHARADYPRRDVVCAYGTATTDPLGRDDWPISKTTHLPVRPKKEKAT